MADFGAWSLVPPLLAIILAIITRRAVLSLFLGVWSGGLIFTFSDSFNMLSDGFADLGVPDTGLGLGNIPFFPWDPTLLDLVAGFFAIFVSALWGIPQGFDWIAESIGASVFHAQILIFTLLLGSAVAMIWRLGGSYAMRDWALKRLESQRQAGAATFVLGLIMFFDDYANTAIVGSAMKDVSDRLRISKEKFSYIVDSTAAPVATLAISSWVAFQISMIEVGYGNIPEDQLAEPDYPSFFEVFLMSIPFNMYSILALFMVGIIVFTGRDYGEMLLAEHRSWKHGLISREEAVPMQDIEADLGEPDVDQLRLSVFYIPILVLIAGVILSAIWTGYPAAETTWEIITEADYAAALVYGSFAMVASTFYLGYRYDLISLRESVDTTIDGFGLMLTAVSILVLAWSIGVVVDVLETGEYIGGFAEEILTPAILPAIVLLLAAFIAFSTGTSWGTMGILTPIAIPVAWTIAPEHTYIAVIVGAVFSGAIFGDHTSPISDTSVLSSTFTGADLIDHVRTQLYYAVTVGLVAVLLLLAWGYGMEHVWGTSIPAAIGLLAIGVIILIGLVYALSEFHSSRLGVGPIAQKEEQVEPMDLGGD